MRYTQSRNAGRENVMPNMPNMHELRKLAIKSPVVKAHLDLWERGAFCSLERMLLSLTCRLGIEIAAATPPSVSVQVISEL